MQEKNHRNLAKIVIIFIGILIPSFIFFGPLKGPIYSATSDTVNLQGKIVRNDVGHEGLNVTEGYPACVVSGSGNDTCDFRVRYYDASTVGNLLLTEEFSNVEIGQYLGVFNISLGSDLSPVAGVYSSFSGLIQGEDDVYVEMGFDPAGSNTYTEVFSRMPLEATAYAVRAKYADNATGATEIPWSGLKDPTADLTIEHTTRKTLFNWATGTGTNDLFTLTSEASATGTGALMNIQTGVGASLMPLRIRAGTTEALMVDNQGRVGIGITAPTTQLHTTGGVRFAGLSSSTQATAVMTDANGNLSTRALGLLAFEDTGSGDNWGTQVVESDSTLTGTGITSSLLGLNLANANTWTGSQTFSASTYFPGSGIWNNSGDVGIGIQTPGSKLHVSGSSTSLVNLGDTIYVDSTNKRVGIGGGAPAVRLHIQETTGGVNQAYMTNVGTTDAENQFLFSTGYGEVSEKWAGIGQAYNDGSLRFTADGNFSTPHMTLLPNGNFGIGTLTPSSKLTLYGSSTATTIGGFEVGMRIANTDTTTNNWQSLVFGDTAKAGIEVKNVDHTNNYGDIALTTRASDGWLPRIYIQSAGNVGIGTTNPLAKLHVKGNQITLKNEADADLRLVLDSGSSTAYRDAITFRDRGTDIFALEKTNTNALQLYDYSGGTGASRMVVEAGANSGISFRTKGEGDFSFINDITTRVTIKSDGKVGIGTTSPSEYFSIGSTSQFRIDSSGNITRIRDVAYSWPSSQGAASTVLTNDGSGNLSWGTAGIKWNDIQDPDGNQSLSMGAYNTSWSWTTGLFSSEWTSNAGTNNLFSLTTGNITGTGALFNVQTGSTATINPMRVRAGSTEALAVDDDGNVGIGTTTPGTKLTVMGGNNINLSYPDGLVGTPVTENLKSGYTVPSGKTLYITNVGAYQASSGYFYVNLNIDGKRIVYGSWTTQNYQLYGEYVSLNQPVVVGSGSTVSSGTSSYVSYFNGFLVNSNVTPVTENLRSGYTVPSGKTLYITNVGAYAVYSWNIRLYIDGKQIIFGNSGYTPVLRFVSLNQPVVVGSGSTVSSGTSSYDSYFNGYLTPSTGVGGADLAETFFIVNGGEPGDVVSIDELSTKAFPAVSKTQKSYDNKLAGIITTKPGMLLEDETTKESSKLKLGVALTGRVPTKVTTQGGVIKQGDPITSSSTVGFGMKATKQGAIVSKALEEFNPGQGKGEIIACPEGTPSNIVCGKILTFVNVSWFDSPSSFDAINEIKSLQAQFNTLKISRQEMLLEQQRMTSNQDKLEKQINANSISLASIRNSGLMGILAVQNLNGSSTTSLVTQTNIVPNLTNTYNLGITDRRWKDIYAQGTINLGNEEDSGGIKYDTETKELEFTNDGQNWIALGFPQKSVLLSAQYPGSVVSDNTGINGIMTTNSTDIDNNSMNYYEWVSSQPDLNTNKIKIRYQIPSDFKQWGDGGITFKYATESIDEEENKLDFYIYDQASDVPETISLDHVSSVEEKWESVEVLGLPFNKCSSPGDVCMFVIEMSSSKDYYTRVGDVEIKYKRNL